jgi:hypothetical protein
MFLDHLVEVAHAFDGHDAIRFHYTTPAGEGPSPSTAARLVDLGVEPVSFDGVADEAWDAVCFSAHLGTERFAPSTPKVFVSHGVAPGQVVNGEEWRYGPGQTIRHGSCVYSLMFESSEANTQRITRALPHLAGVVRTVGSPQIEAVVGAASDPDLCARNRRQLGLADEAETLLIQSTWGPNSMIERWHSELLDAAVEVSRLPGFQVLMSLHPHTRTGRWGARAFGDETLARQSPTFRVVPHGTPPENYLPLADVGLFDHSSLSIPFALLGKPLLFDSMNPVYAPGSLVLSLHESCEQLHRAADLPAALTRNRGAFSMPPQDLVATFVSHLGQSHQRIRSEVTSLLG